MIRASTAGSPNEGVTSGSLSIQQSGRALRHVCAEIRHIFLAQRLGPARGRNRCARHRRRQRSPVPAMSRPAIGSWPTRFRWIVTRRRARWRSRRRGERWPEAPCSGSIFPTRCLRSRASFRIAALPGMLHGRVLRSEISGAKLVDLKEDGARAIAGLVAIVRDGNFAGVVCETEHGAESALKALRKGATWSGGEALPDEDDLASFLKSQPSELTVIDTRKAASIIPKDAHDPAAIHPSLHRACLDRAVLRHGAVDESDRVHVWTHSQGVYLLRADLALVLRIAGRKYHGRAYGGRRLLRTQRRRRCRARRGSAGARRPQAGRCACNGRAPTR